MKKLYPIVLSIFMLNACKEFKALNAEKTINIPNVKLFFSDSAYSSIRANVNNKEHSFIFDLGAQRSCYNRSNLIEQTQTFSHRLKGIDNTTGAKKTNLIPIDSFTSPIFKSRNVLFLLRDLKKDCNPSSDINIVGANIIAGEYPIFLNYKDGYIEFIDESFDKSKFLLVPSKFATLRGLIYIYLKVNGLTYKFLFDTGNFGAPIYLSNKVHSNTKADYEIDNIVYDINENNKIHTFNEYQNQNIELGQNSELKLKLSFANSPVIDNNIGFSFIRNFNWIIDPKHKKVYCKLNNQDLLETRFNKNLAKQTAGLQKGYIIVDAVRKGVSKYQCGDTIVSVQNTPVIAENICSLYKILASSNNWDTLNVVVQTRKNQ
jgi:hypothetical protein